MKKKKATGHIHDHFFKHKFVYKENKTKESFSIFSGDTLVATVHHWSYQLPAFICHACNIYSDLHNRIILAEEKVEEANKRVNKIKFTLKELKIRMTGLLYHSYWKDLIEVWHGIIDKAIKEE